MAMPSGFGPRRSLLSWCRICGWEHGDDACQTMAWPLEVYGRENLQQKLRQQCESIQLLSIYENSKILQVSRKCHPIKTPLVPKLRLRSVYSYSSHTTT